MEIHKPRPWHGARELGKEIGTIVIGVLIALAGEQAVQSFEWAHKVHLAEALMRQEISEDDGPQAYGRVALAPCRRQQLTELRRLIEGSANRGAIAERIQAVKPAIFTWDSAAYTAAASSGALVHLPANRLSAISQFYELMPDLNAHSRTEATSHARLTALSTKGGPLSDSERLALLTSVEELQNENMWIRADAMNAVDAIHRAGVGLDSSGEASFGRFIAFVRRPELAGCLAKGSSDLRAMTSGENKTRYFPARLDTPPASPDQ